MLQTWTLSAKDKSKLDAFGMWCWRRLLRIPWTAKRTNKYILDELNTRDSFSQLGKRRILSYYGHITRCGPENMEKTIIQGKIEGFRQRGCPHSRWIDQIKKLLGRSFEATLRLTEDRGKWREMIQEVTSLQT